MAQLEWHEIGERVFEAGIDHGVLYLDDEPGVPWNGLVSVSESPFSGELVSYYLDGINYLLKHNKEEFQATIEAYTYPEEFNPCIGIGSIGNGLFATNQSKQSFGLSYRTKVGNDVDGIDHGYKIHLIYNVMAAPTTRDNATLTDTIDPNNFSWKILAKPSNFVGASPTPHFIIDSREIDEDVLSEINDILYGSETTDPRLPSTTELMFIFGYSPLLFDAGVLGEEYEFTVDSGVIPEEQTETVDAGTP